MNRNYLIAGLLQFIIIASAILFSPVASSQDLSEAQKQERCQNNKNRIAELEKQLQSVNEAISHTTSAKEIEDARNDMAYVRKRKPDLELHFSVKLQLIGAKYNFDLKGCDQYVRATMSSSESWHRCLTDLENIIAKKIKKAKTQKPTWDELGNRKSAIDKEIAKHKTNLIALGCEAINSAGWAGTWAYADDRGTMTLAGSGSSVSGKTKYAISDWKSDNTVTGCNETGTNTIRCNFTAAYEDTDKFVDIAGTVEMTFAGNSISSTWKEVGPPDIRWKPGRPKYSVSYIWKDGQVWRETFKRK